MQKEKPKMILRFGADHNSLTINEGAQATVIDLNVLTRDDAARVQRMAVEAWCKINGIANTVTERKRRSTSRPDRQKRRSHGKEARSKARTEIHA